MPTEREWSQERLKNPFAPESRGLQFGIGTNVDLETLAAFDRERRKDGWPYRSALMRHLIVQWLRQRNALPM